MSRSAATNASRFDVSLEDLQAWSADRDNDPSTAAVFAFDPIGEFLRRLRTEVPQTEGSVSCFLDDDGDAFVEFVVQDFDAEWELSETMAPVTLDILERTGMYVGLICLSPEPTD